MISLKSMLLIVTVLFQVGIYKINYRDQRFLPFFILIVYSIKPVYESYLPFLDLLFQLLIVLGISRELFMFIKRDVFLKFDKYLLFFLLLILFNGLYNLVAGNLLDTNYFKGVLNYSFIMLLIFYLMNTINNCKEFKDILRMSKYNIILIFTYSIIDKFFLNLQRVGDEINPNYLSQMCLVLLLFYIYSSRKKTSFIIFIFYFMSLFVIFSTGSSSGILGLSILLFSFIIFKLNSKKLIVLSNYLVWVTITYFMYIILFTSNYEVGILKYFVKSEDTSRILLWQYTFESIKSHPIMGVLYNTFRAPWGSLEMVTHNDYLRLMAELGVGSIFLLFILVKKQIRIITDYNLVDGLFLYSFIMIILVFSLSHNNINNFMFWFALTLPSMSVFRYSTEYF